MNGAESLHDAPETLSFFDLLRRLERTRGDKARIGDSGARDDEIVILGQNPFIEFPDSNVSWFGRDKQGRYSLHSQFLGLLGPQGALPLHTTYEACHWLGMRDESFARFLDIFNNRFLQLFFRAWSDARPAGQFDRPDLDRFFAYVGSGVGIGTPSFRRRGKVSDHTKLAVAGLLAPAVKSASRVRGLVAYLFNADVEIEQCIGMWLPLERADQSAISKTNSRLGADALLGSSVFSLQDKFRIRLRAKNLAEFESYLPGGDRCDKLAETIYFYLGEILAYEVQLGLPERETLPAQLGRFGRLGWTSWLKAGGDTGGDIDRWDCRFHPAERVGTGLPAS